MLALHCVYRAELMCHGRIIDVYVQKRPWSHNVQHTRHTRVDGVNQSHTAKFFFNQQLLNKEAFENFVCIEENVGNRHFLLPIKIVSIFKQEFQSESHNHLSIRKAYNFRWSKISSYDTEMSTERQKKTRWLSRDNLLSLCDFDLCPAWMKLSNGSSIHWGEQFCQTILKSIHKYRSYCLEKYGRTDDRIYTLKETLSPSPPASSRKILRCLLKILQFYVPDVKPPCYLLFLQFQRNPSLPICQSLNLQVSQYFMMSGCQFISQWREN